VDGEKTKAAVFFGGQDPLTSDNNTIRDNILTYNATYGIDATWGNSIGTGNVASHNCLYGNVSGPFGGTQGWTNQGSNVLDDPLYVNRAGKDFRLQAGAPCAGMGPS